jgi:hypothetical protein
VDILMLPADGAYHLLTSGQTDQILRELKPSLVIPMHYYIPEFEDEPMEDFGSLGDWLTGRKNIVCLPGNSWVVSKKTLPEKPEILVPKIADSTYEANNKTPPEGTICADMNSRPTTSAN